MTDNSDKNLAERIEAGDSSAETELFQKFGSRIARIVTYQLGYSNPDWQDLAPILLHPLRKPNHELLIYDKIIRSRPLDEHKLPFSAREFLKDYQYTDIKQLKDKIDLFIKDLDINSDPEKKVCAKFVDILDELIKDLNLIYHELDLSRVYQEMLVRIKKESIQRRDQTNGIHVLGFLDSLGSVSDKLYVMGMVEGDIPRPENENPCFNPKEPINRSIKATS